MERLARDYFNGIMCGILAMCVIFSAAHWQAMKGHAILPGAHIEILKTRTGEPSPVPLCYVADRASPWFNQYQPCHDVRAERPA